MIDYDIALQQALVNGEKRAIAWGNSADAALQIVKAPYRFEMLIDGLADPHYNGSEIAGVPIKGSAALDGIDPPDVVIIVFADAKLFGAEILQQLTELGFDQVSLPYSVWYHQSVESSMAALSPLFAIPPQPLRTETKKASLLIHKLVRGGAEYQICLLAIGLCRIGYEVELISYAATVKECEVWETELLQAGVKRTILPYCRDCAAQYLTHSEQIDKPVLGVLSGAGYHIYHQLSAHLEQVNPSLVVGYLDDANILVSLAALKAGVPRIVLSGRNAAPVHFPALNTQALSKVAMRAIYQSLADLPQCRITNNSVRGARSYEDWLEIEENSIGVITNAVHDFGQPKVDIRQRHKIGNNTPLIIGVMRLSEEKRPSLWLESVARLLTRVAGTAMLIGDGGLRAELQQQADSLGIGPDRLIFAGVVSNVPDYMQQADLLIHTPREEGTPNVIIEALHYQLPLVTTPAGAIESMLPHTLHEMCMASNATADEIAEKGAALLNNQAFYLSQTRDITVGSSPQELAIQTCETAVA